MLKRLIVFILTAAGFSLADSFLFTFDPNDLIELYTSGESGSYRPEQDNPRLVYQRNPLNLEDAAATFTDHPSRGSRWEGDSNHYADWLAGLGTGEGIRAFNIWITPADYLGSYGNPYSREDTLQQMYSLSNNIVGWNGTASGDWTAEVNMIYSNSTVGPSYGIQWSTTNSEAYLRPGGADLGSFSFTLSDVAVNELGDSPQDGQAYNFWFGSYSLTFDDQGWGTSSTGAAFSSPDGDGAGWEGSMALTAQTIPEPNVTALFGTAAVIFIVRKRARRWWS